MISHLIYIKKKHIPLLLAFFICLTFFAAFSTLSIIRHLHYESYGFDLGINDQTVWRYSKFEAPLTTIDPFPDRTKLDAHVELVYALIAPFYWVWPARKMLLLVSAFTVCSGAFAAFLYSQKRLKNYFLSFALMLSYLMFYGLQNAVWFDVHSSNFAASFLMWFIYFLDRKRAKWAILFFFLAITAKENIALYTLTLSLLYLIRRRSKLILFFAITSIAYLFFIYFIYFPHIVKVSYLYSNKAGILSNLNPFFLVNTREKIMTIFYSFASFGFLPLLNPLTLPLIFAHFTTFFVIASDLPGAQGLYGHYRVTLAPLFVWSSVVTIGTFRFLNNKYIALYLVVCTLFLQYFLHLPLSYITKEWFWEKPAAETYINTLIDKYLPPDASVVSQNNITPHISHRDQIYTLYYDIKDFPTNTPCSAPKCEWLHWFSNPEFLIVDVSSGWDARHLLVDRPQFIQALNNMEHANAIRLYKQVGTAKLYKVIYSNK